VATAAGASTAASVWTHFMCPASRLWCLSRDRERVKERCHAFMRTLFGCFLCGFELKISSFLPQTNRALLCGKLREKSARFEGRRSGPFEGASDRNPRAFLRSRSFSLTK
jgi:hypothetical protein